MGAPLQQLLFLGCNKHFKHNNTITTTWSFLLERYHSWDQSTLSTWKVMHRANTLFAAMSHTCWNLPHVCMGLLVRHAGCRPRVIPMSPLGTADHRTVRLTGVRGLVHLVITKWCCCIRLGSTPCLLQKRPRHYSRADPHPLPSTRLHMSLTCLKTGQEMCSMTCSTL